MGKNALENKVPELRNADLTYRDKARNYANDILRYIGLDKYNAGKYSDAIFGGFTSPGGFGLVDLPPAMAVAAPMYAQDAYNKVTKRVPYLVEEGNKNLGEGEYKNALKDYGNAGLNVGLAVLDTLPIAHYASKPISETADFLSKGGMKTLLADETGSWTPFGNGGGGGKSKEELEQNLMSWFGNKEKEEAARSKKLQKGITPTEGKKVQERTKKGAVNFDVYRKMNETLGTDAVLDVLRKGEHLRPDGKGGYIGAPKVINSPQSLGRMRKALDEKFEQGVDALTLADPNRVGTWYDRAKGAQSLTNEPYQLDRNLEQHAAYSAGVSPESELAFALKHGTSRAIGDPIVAYRKPVAERLDKAVAAGEPMKLGPKISMYKMQNDPRVPNEGPFGVNDFRAAQTFGYTKPDGSPFQGTVSSTMHPFMDAETALMTDRANTNAVGGRTDWQGPHTQEVPWITGKAQDLYKRGSKKKGKYAGDKLEGSQEALRDANKTFEDFLYKHLFSATNEQIPGKNTGHIPELLNAPYEERLAYSNAVPWERKIEAEDPEVRDTILAALGFRQAPPLKSVGYYKNSAGQVETNPMTIARALVPYPTGSANLSDETMAALDLGENLRNIVNAQEMYAGNMPNTRNISGKNAVVLDTRTPENVVSGVQPTGEQLAALDDILGQYGYGATATNRGVLAYPYESKTTAKDLNKMLKKSEAKLKDVLPNATLEKGIVDSFYRPALGKYTEDDKIVPTAPFSGEATMNFLAKAAKVNPEVAKNLSESEPVRMVLDDIIKRDAQYASSREDIQNTRKFFRDADWSKAVELIRKGMSPAAALAALGYSFSALAGDERPAR